MSMLLNIDVLRFHIADLSLSIVTVMTTLAFAQSEEQETASSQVLPVLQFAAQAQDKNRPMQQP